MRRRGFTLIELLVVIAIIALLLAILTMGPDLFNVHR
ncbi:MAG: prepilin-type N-terminal cleavage/methylation domain-containing protein [Planctomycetota bacterium]